MSEAITMETRRESYNLLDKAKRQEEVMGAFRHYGDMTARQCGKRLGYQDLNGVKPRITELCQSGKLLKAKDKVFDSETGRSVAVFGVVS